uniref:Uncharacterized protein n=1 Tax=Arundo donax TaxID=35708 RepID=A0A0A9BR01_ARUDO
MLMHHPPLPLLQLRSRAMAPTDGFRCAHRSLGLLRVSGQRRCQGSSMPAVAADRRLAEGAGSRAPSTQRP